MTLENLLEKIGVEDIRPLGEEIQARCPLHEKRTGSREHRPDNWSINRHSCKHHCFSCGYAGSLVRLIVDVTGQGLWDAHKLIRAFDISPEEAEHLEPFSNANDRAQLVDMAGFGPPPPRAVERRRLKSGSLERYGVCWDYEESAWIFPILSPLGILGGYQVKGADYVRNRPPGIKKGKTLFGMHLFVGRAERKLVLVESPLDAVYLDGLGYPAVAAFGVNVSDDQMRLLIEQSEAIVLALDDDTAGRAETRRLLSGGWHHRIPVTVFNYKGASGKDPGECLPAQAAQGIDNAVPAVYWS